MMGLFHKASIMPKIFGLSTTKFRSYKGSTMKVAKTKKKAKTRAETLMTCSMAMGQVFEEYIVLS